MYRTSRPAPPTRAAPVPLKSNFPVPRAGTAVTTTAAGDGDVEDGPTDGTADGDGAAGGAEESAGDGDGAAVGTDAVPKPYQITPTPAMTVTASAPIIPRGRPMAALHHEIHVRWGP
ncbi:hypothetical protein GCM10010532_058190 [Dactylosporangium siamense]|uniref:Uncharacterized protein n=1 Tax=Dactylosporangium siamense TaxID=685454 RepID=A0A919PQ11_9ACTN|nr:hypothetical protein Dsi01nite_042790 [Dactylosporangium siamense]